MHGGTSCGGLSLPLVDWQVPPAWKVSGPGPLGCAPSSCYSMEHRQPIGNVESQAQPQAARSKWPSDESQGNCVWGGVCSCACVRVCMRTAAWKQSVSLSGLSLSQQQPGGETTVECCMPEGKWGAFAADVAISVGPEWICVRSQSPGNPPGRDTAWIECEVKTP